MCSGKRGVGIRTEQFLNAVRFFRVSPCFLRPKKILHGNGAATCGKLPATANVDTLRNGASGSFVVNHIRPDDAFRLLFSQLDVGYSNPLVVLLSGSVQHLICLGYTRRFTYVS